MKSRRLMILMAMMFMLILFAGAGCGDDDDSESDPGQALEDDDDATDDDDHASDDDDSVGDDDDDDDNDDEPDGPKLAVLSDLHLWYPETDLGDETTEPAYPALLVHEALQYIRNEGPDISRAAICTWITSAF